MADTTHIEWTDATWNPITGCSMVSAGCTNCYAMGLAATRLRHHPSREGLTRIAGGRAVWTGEVRLNEQWLSQPLRWKRPRKIFVCAHGDLFHEAVPDEWIDRVFAVMAMAPHHTFQVLTKRPERMAAYLSVPGRVGDVLDACLGYLQTPGHIKPRIVEDGIQLLTLPNVWLGTSVEDQATADARIPHLLATPAAVRFLSCEPLLGPLDIEAYQPDFALWLGASGGLGWVIVGGESGPGARPMHPNWARTLLDQCQAAGVAFHFKQWGEWAPVVLEADEDGNPGAAYPMKGCSDPSQHRHDQACRFWQDGEMVSWPLVETMPAIGVRRVGKRAAGRLLDGRTWDQFPGDSDNG